ncbi:group II intron reverse transcriptase/maturase [Thiocapsa bogorovii]|uniref:group II intron reverse transcriptase/maturase n=1 Tax=Thiocapsa bogorovii TaxID=521689 RepID=UPI001E5A3619|nr:group II intron reverse transcriptase/maturase [Thiocapsa bogorovii]UHD15444.1 group II intron reverse transcriptase/maturase [Thiocapsa bogorovii]
MSTESRRLGEKARNDPRLVFSSLHHHVCDVDHLRACFEALPADRAVGIDGITKERYGANLEENLEALSSRLRNMGYRPQPKRRTYIPKPGSEKGRPLAISCFEDKLVELAIKRVLEPIYEVQFEDRSYGYRPGRSQHRCLDDLGRTIQQRRINYIVEADIRSFFNEVDHGWMLKFLRHRIGDPRIVRLIARLLKGGILEDGLVQASEEGTPQGSILSPLLSNIYLHYVLDLWFSYRVRPQSRGEAYYFRFADDFVAGFQNRQDAEHFQTALGERLRTFRLRLAEEKTRCLAFGRFARDNARARGEKPEEFTFLGFTHYCGKSKKGHFKVKRRTSRKKFGASLRAFNDWARRVRHKQTKGEMLIRAKARIQGHLNYYAITDNARSCSRYVYHATRILRRWLNRKSQRKAYNWDQYNDVLREVAWPRVQIRTDLNPFRRAEAC